MFYDVHCVFYRLRCGYMSGFVSMLTIVRFVVLYTKFLMITVGLGI